MNENHKLCKDYKINSLITLITIIISLLVNSCGVVSGIFKAGMDFGIFIVIAIVVIIAYIVIRLRRNR
jgi:hypothetical protein